MAGLGEGGRPSSAPPPQGTHACVGWQSLRLISPTPTAPNKRRSPLPQGLLPTPTWAVHSVVFSSPMAQGATGWGRWPISLSWTAAVTWVCWSILGPTVCAICFLKYSTQPYQSHRPIRNISPNIRN